MMPTYTARDSQTGKTVTFKWNGEAPPTDADMGEVFAAASKVSPPTPFFPRMPASSSMGEIDPGLMSESQGIPAGLEGQTVTGAPPRGLIPMITTGLGGLGGGYYGGLVGAGGGSALEDMWYGAAGEPVSGEQMAANAAGSMILQGAGGRAMTPVPVPQEWQDLAAAAKSGGIPLSLQSITGGQRGNILEGAANLTLGGKWVTEKALTRARDLTMSLRGKILEGLAGAPGHTAGKTMSELTTMKKDFMYPKTKDAYSPLQLELGEELVSVPNIEKAIERSLGKIPATPQNEKGIAHLQGVLTDIRKQGGKLRGSALYDFQSMVNRTYGKYQSTVVDPIVDSIGKDLSGFSIDKGLEQNLSTIYLNARNASRNEAGFDTVYKIFSRSSKLDPVTGKEVFYAGMLESEMNRNRQQIFSKFGAEKGAKIMKQMEDLAVIFKAAARESEFLAGKTETGKAIGKAWDIAQGMGALGGAVPQGRGVSTGILLANGTGLALAAALTNPTINKHLIGLMKTVSKVKGALGSVPPALRGAVPVAIGKNVMGGN